MGLFEIKSQVSYYEAVAQDEIPGSNQRSEHGMWEVMDGGCMPLPTHPQQYRDPASLVICLWELVWMSVMSVSLSVCQSVCHSIILFKPYLFVPI